MDSIADQIPVPRYSIPTIIKHRKQLLQELYSSTGWTLTGKYFDEVVDIVIRALKLDRQIAYDSLRYLAGQELTLERAEELSWRMAGNFRTLRGDEKHKARPVPPWNGQYMAEWVPVQVVGWEPDHDRQHRFGGRFRMQILAGSPCPVQIFKFWTRGFCGVLARDIGYSRSYGKRPLDNIAELVRMRMLVLLEPRLSRQRPGFFHIKCQPAMKKWNQYIIDLRNRVRDGDDWPCPRGYTHQCYNCHVGFNDCPAATHELTFPNPAAFTGLANTV